MNTEVDYVSKKMLMLSNHLLTPKCTAKHHIIQKQIKTSFFAKNVTLYVMFWNTILYSGDVDF